jgi:hypothetical protein
VLISTRAQFLVRHPVIAVQHLLGSLPEMHPEEVAEYIGQLKGVRQLIEFGTGGSTLLALRRGVGNIVAVETDPAWIASLRENSRIQRAEQSRRLKLLHADVGPVGAWGTPIAPTHGGDYVSAPWSYCSDPDMVFIDGRFRVAAALEALLRCRSSARIIVHDFWGRPEYHAILPFVDCLAKVNSLAAFQRKRDAIPAEIRDAQARHLTDAR